MHQVVMQFEDDSRPVKFRPSFQECCRWCNEHTGLRSRTANTDAFMADTNAKWFVDWVDSTHEQVKFVFKDSSQAVLFKLTWGGN